MCHLSSCSDLYLPAAPQNTGVGVEEAEAQSTGVGVEEAEAQSTGVGVQEAEVQSTDVGSASYMLLWVLFALLATLLVLGVGTVMAARRIKR
jgi:hypothetical protein